MYTRVSLQGRDAEAKVERRSSFLFAYGMQLSYTLQHSDDERVTGGENQQTFPEEASRKILRGQVDLNGCYGTKHKEKETKCVLD